MRKFSWISSQVSCYTSSRDSDNNFHFLLLAISFAGIADISDDIPGIGQYEDFHTIDWQRDLARDRMRHRYIVKKRHNSIFDTILVSIIAFPQLFKILIFRLFNFRELTMPYLVGFVCY